MIDTVSYKLPESNYYKVEYTKSQIVIGDTLRNNMDHFKGWLTRHNGEYKKTSAFTVDRDGKIYQHYDPKYYSDYITEYDMAPFNIPITLVNNGWLNRESLNDRYTDWLGHHHVLDDDEVLNHSWRGKRYWLKYTEKQLQSLKILTDKLCEDFGIKNVCVNNNTFNEDVDIYEGITFKSNYYEESTDIGPSFNMELFKN